MSLPRKTILPPEGETSLRRTLPRVVFPLPLSPASAKISPFDREKLTSSTAFTFISSLLKTVSKNPRFSGYHFLRFSIDMTGARESSDRPRPPLLVQSVAGQAADPPRPL